MCTNARTHAGQTAQNTHTHTYTSTALNEQAPLSSHTPLLISTYLDPLYIGVDIIGSGTTIRHIAAVQAREMSKQEGLCRKKDRE
jgi:hypothetical protein